MASNVLQPTESAASPFCQTRLYYSSVDAIKLNVIITQNLALYWWNMMNLSLFPAWRYREACWDGFWVLQTFEGAKHQRQNQRSQQKQKN